MLRHASKRSICASVLPPSPNNTDHTIVGSNAQSRASSSGDSPRSAMTARKLAAKVIAVLTTEPFRRSFGSPPEVSQE